jgi:DNA-binding protein HU-beta
MYKSVLVRAIAGDTRLSQRLVNEVLSHSLAAIAATLRDGEAVVLPGFGTFYTRDRAERTVRHIATGQAITVPAGRQAAFRAGALLRQAVGKTPRRRARRAERTDAVA